MHTFTVTLDVLFQRCPLRHARDTARFSALLFRGASRYHLALVVGQAAAALKLKLKVWHLYHDAVQLDRKFDVKFT